MIFGVPVKQRIREVDSLDNVDGVVTRLFNDDEDHDIRKAILKNNQVYEISREWESQVETGDSLHKEKGTFLLEVYKKNRKKIVLDYRSILSPE